MADFVFVYRTPNAVAQSRSEAGKYTASSDHLAGWEAWFSEIGASVTGPGSPAFARSTLGETGPGTALAGYTIITADDLEAAVALAQGCPVLRQGGGVEVGELTTVTTA
jgi:hypothetical protein